MPVWITSAAVVTIIVIGIIVLVELVALTALLFVAKNLMQEMRERVEPLIDKANDLLEAVKNTAVNVQDKAEHIGETTVHTTDVVGERVDKISAALHRVVAAPIVQGAALGEGIRRGVNAWRRARTTHTHRQSSVTTTPPVE